MSEEKCTKCGQCSITITKATPPLAICDCCGNQWVREISEEKQPVGRPPAFSNAMELQEKIKSYFESLDVKGTDGKVVMTAPALITGLALHLGFCSRQSFYDYEKKEEFTYTVKKARMMVEKSYELNLLGKGSTGAIFALKNMGWTDKQEIKQDVTVTGNPVIQFGDTSKKDEDEH